MNSAPFKKSGHWPTLATAFLYFDVSFMVWTMLKTLPVARLFSPRRRVEAGLKHCSPLIAATQPQNGTFSSSDKWAADSVATAGVTADVAPALLGASG